MLIKILFTTNMFVAQAPAAGRSPMYSIYIYWGLPAVGAASFGKICY